MADGLVAGQAKAAVNIAGGADDSFLGGGGQFFSDAKRGVLSLTNQGQKLNAVVCRLP
jgi:hypothetical protein